MSNCEPPLVVALLRGLRKRCPHCGVGSLFDGWYTPRDACPSCRLDFQASEGHTWGFMYLSTAFLTGVIVLGMFWIRPRIMLLGQGVVFLLAILIIVGSLPYRKGLAIALDYWFSRRLY